MVSGNEQGSLLTPSQREYIKGDSEVGPGTNHARAVDSRIRTRLRWGMYDFALLLGHLDPKERKKVFDEKGNKKDEEGLRGTLPVRTTIIDALGFFYLVLTDLDDWWTQQERWEELDRYDAAAEKFAELLSRGVERAFTREGVSIEGVDIEINIDRGKSLSTLAEMPLEEHSERILGQLLEAEEITPTEYGEAQQVKINRRRGLPPDE